MPKSLNNDIIPGTEKKISKCDRSDTNNFMTNAYIMSEQYLLHFGVGSKCSPVHGLVLGLFPKAKFSTVGPDCMAIVSNPSKQ